MPLHDYIKQIYQEVPDSAYIIRFLDYLISKRFKFCTFSVNGYKAIALITGILEDNQTKQHYHSIEEFYSKATGTTCQKNDITILKKIYVIPNYSVWRIICSAKENEILGFFDQKYRSFLLYRDVRKRVKSYTNIITNDKIVLIWNNSKFDICHTSIICHDDSKKAYEFLETYEDGGIEGLYYCTDNSQYLICN
jgi:hypothetical protein